MPRTVRGGPRPIHRVRPQSEGSAPRMMRAYELMVIIDGDVERRHRPTVWKLHGVPDAIIAGGTALLLCPETYYNESGRAVSEAARFLKIEPDSRSAGMGNAGVALADNASATFWNSSASVSAVPVMPARAR